MAVSLILTEQIIKLFIILLLGFLLVKFGLLKASDSKSVSVILVYLILPCMIINAFQIDYTPGAYRSDIHPLPHGAETP